MVRSFWTLALATLFVAAPASLAQLANSPHPNILPRPSVPLIDVDNLNRTDVNGVPLPPLDTIYLFDQLVDHQNPRLGTFKQRFWMSREFYIPGGPIVLFSPGETNAEQFTAYLTNATINGQIAQRQHGAVVMLEHRYYGQSNPFPDLKDESLRFHTIQQAIDDLEFFAKTVNLPMPGGGAVKPAQAPWVLVGGSYAGALISWTMNAKPNVFAAGWSSSGVVQAITDFWAYFEPVRQNMPQNCSADVQAVIAHIDQVFTSGSQPQINSIKANFGLQNLTHLDDVVGALRRNLFDWQSLTPVPDPDARFFKFCDALEVSNGAVAPAAGFGLDHAFAAWGRFWKTEYLPTLCGGFSVVDCLGTYNPSQSYYHDTRVDNADRSWLWIVCNEVGFYQVGAHVGTPTLVSRLLRPLYDERLCTYYFRDKFQTPPVPSADAVNQAHNGWGIDVDHIFFANGRRDPWLEATVSAESSPYMASTARPVGVSEGFHCSDLITGYAFYDPTVGAVQCQGLAAIETWIAEFKPASTSNGTRVRFERE